MKIKTLAVLCSLFITAIATTSCLKNDEETIELSPNASITAFSIENIETKVIEKTSSGKDTTIIKTVTGSDYPFVIDQNNRLIYNVDSLPVGTDVSKVVANITSDTNYIIIVNQEDSEKDSLWISGDSLNYTKDIKMKVLAYDGTFGPVYTTKVNVHKQVPDSLTWTKYESDVFSDVEKQKSVYFNGNIYVACNVKGKTMMTHTSSADGKGWSSKKDIPLTGAEISSLMAWGNNLYILASNTLYTSKDGSSWDKVEGAPQLTTLLSNHYGSDTNCSIWGIDANNHFRLYEVTDKSTINWDDKGAVDKNFPTENISYASYASNHNSDIFSQIVMGNRPTNNDSIINAWGDLNTQNEWAEYNNDGQHCPNLKNITMIHYNGALYAFGGQSQGEGVNKVYSPFSNFFVSYNNGADWESITSLVRFPESFATLYNSAGGNYSCTVDNNNFIWIIFSNSNEVWKGRINKLGFNQAK